MIYQNASCKLFIYSTEEGKFTTAIYSAYNMHIKPKIPSAAINYVPQSSLTPFCLLSLSLFYPVHRYRWCPGAG